MSNGHMTHCISKSTFMAASNTWVMLIMVPRYVARGIDVPIEHTMRELNRMPENVLVVAQSRDGSTCSITGSHQAKVTWIVPPEGGERTRKPGDRQPFYDLIEFYKTLENTITVSEAIYPLFVDNKIAIDIEDNYRIIQFEDLLSDVELPSHMPISFCNKPSTERPGEFFLRNHFKYTLWVQFLGGDITNESTNPKVEGMWKELSQESALDDDRWQTPVGQEILIYMTRQAIEDSLHVP
ncbi:hypothetical protein C8J56DRAFT_980440 [Mycena floridula]|nr:hypothetical protein C8J56DRAFT_980440 [Mycena floridula]